MANGRDITLEKALPNSAEAERLILGAILLDNTTINQAAERLKPEDFFVHSHRSIYDKMLRLYEQGLGIDPVTLQEHLRRAGELEQVGGPAYIASLFDGVPRFSNIENYTKLVKGKSTQRRLIAAGNQIVTMAFDDAEEPEIMLDHAERLIFSIADDRIRQGFVPLSEVAQKQLAYIEEASERQQLITGIATGFDDLDYMTAGMQRGDLIIIAARPSMGKCLAADAEILLADGRLATIAELYQKRQATLLTLSDDFKLTLTQPSAFVDDGIKPVFRVTTRLGRFVDSTLTHPYLTVDGWRKLSELKVGDRIAVPRRLSVFGSEQAPNEQLESLAYSLNDGAHDKQIPAFVFRLAKPQLALFLNRLFATDGWVTLTAGQAPQLGYSTVSEKLARQVQHLLLRFGVIAKLRKREIKYAGNRRTAWQLDITHGDSLRTFAAEIGIFGKEERLAQALEALSIEEVRNNRDLIPVQIWETLAQAKGVESWASLASRAGLKGKTNIHVGQRALSRQRLAALAQALDHQQLRALAASDVYWDEIVSLEYLGDKQVYDLTIPVTHNFVANDICVHNTAFALCLAQNAATKPQYHGEKAVVGIFSLEMSKEQLVNRLLCSQARINAHRLRTGHLSKDDWRRLAQAVGELSEARIFLDDTPGISVLEMRAKARRLKTEQKRLDMLVVDYLQLMSGRGRNESRQQEVSQISRELKILAKELDVPLIALSQLSRATETRADHRPQLSDLRESGCLAGESLVTLAASGAQVPIRELAGKSGFHIWALNEATGKLEAAPVSRAFATGVKPVFRLTTRLGRSIRATANHKFKTFAGWKRLDELRIGERLAVPRVLENPAAQSMSNEELALLGHLIGDGCTLPRHAIQYTTREKDLAETVAGLALKVFGKEVNPRIKQERTWYQVYLASMRHHTHGVRSAVAEWLSALGAWGLRSYEKRIPAKVFEQPAAAVGVFLRHLWATDGSIRLRPGFYASAVYYSSSSEELTRGVQTLLLRLGINAWLRRYSQGEKGRDQYHISLTGKPDLERFAERIGAVGAYKQQSLKEVTEYLQGRQPNTNRDVIPNAVWREVIVPAMQAAGLTTRQMTAGINIAHCGSALYKPNLSRERAARIAQVVNSDTLALLAHSDIYWDQIVAIEPDGESDVYDLTVPHLHNFVANNSFVHNSLEQDADVVMFIYRDEVYKPESEKQNSAEIIIGKQRNGPIGSVDLIFVKEFTRFETRHFGNESYGDS